MIRNKQSIDGKSTTDEKLMREWSDAKSAIEGKNSSQRMMVTREKKRGARLEAQIPDHETVMERECGKVNEDDQDRLVEMKTKLDEVG